MSNEMTPEEVVSFVNGEIVPDWDVSSVKEEKTLIPTTKDVVAKISDYKIFGKYKDNSERLWKFFILKLVLTDGVDVLGELKFKNSILDSKMIAYFADKTRYSDKKYDSLQHLVDLMKLSRAVGSSPRMCLARGTTDANIEEWLESIKNTKLLITVSSRKINILNQETGKYEPSEDVENVAINYKKLPEEMSI